MMNKEIVFTAPMRAELLDCEINPPRADEVTVELAYSAISAGTERANFVGERNGPGISEEDAPIFPRRVGYSASGRITALGEGVTDLAIGDRVIVFWGSHRRYRTISRANVVRIPDGVSLEDAAFALISTFPLAAIRKTHLEIGESALVMGLGILGIFAVQMLRAAGAYPIVAVDPKPERREMALRLGADFAFDPTAPDFTECVKSVTEGGASVCIEVTGLGIGLIQALDCMREMGRVALLGCTRSSKFEIDYYGKVHGRGISLIGAHTKARPKTESSSGLWTDLDDLKTFLGLLKGGRLKVRDLVSEIHSPADAQAVYDRLAEGRDFPIGVLFDWSKI